MRTVQKVPYRLLEAVLELGAGETNTENMLIQGDNLQALKALLPLYARKVKCIYIRAIALKISFKSTSYIFMFIDNSSEHHFQQIILIPPSFEAFIFTSCTADLKLS